MLRRPDASDATRSPNECGAKARALQDSPIETYRPSALTILPKKRETRAIQLELHHHDDTPPSPDARRDNNRSATPGTDIVCASSRGTHQAVGAGGLGSALAKEPSWSYGTRRRDARRPIPRGLVRSAKPRRERRFPQWIGRAVKGRRIA